MHDMPFNYIFEVLGSGSIHYSRDNHNNSRDPRMHTYNSNRAGQAVSFSRFATKVRKARSNFTLLHATVDPDENKRLEAVYLSIERRDFEFGLIAHDTRQSEASDLEARHDILEALIKHGTL